MKLVIELIALALLAAGIQPVMAEPPAGGHSTEPAAPDPAAADAQFANMQERMKLMQSQMEAIGKTQDPKERQRLLQEHWTAMQSMMATMHGTWGGMMGPGGGGGRGQMMGGPGMGRHMMWKDYRALTPEQLRERQYMMDRWMPMHQMMMEQMMQHQHWMMQQPAETPPKK